MSSQYEVEPRAHTKDRKGSAIVCPYCQTRGYVKTRKQRKGMGVSGEKLAAMFLTFGISLLFVGLSRRVRVTKMHCENCGMRWEA